MGWETCEYLYAEWVCIPGRAAPSIGVFCRQYARTSAQHHTSVCETKWRHIVYTWFWNGAHVDCCLKYIFMILRTAAADCVIVTYKLMLDMSHFRLLWNSSKLRLLDLTGTERPLCDTLIEHVPLTSLEVLYLARSASAKETNLPQILAAVRLSLFVF